MCETGFTGTLCESNVPSSDDPTAAALTSTSDRDLGLSLGFVLLVVLIVAVIVFFYRKKQMSKMSGKYHPSDEEVRDGAFPMSFFEKDERLI